MKKLLSVFLSLSMVLSVFPQVSFAAYISDDVGYIDYSKNEDEYYQRAVEYFDYLYQQNMPSSVTKNSDGTYDWSEYDGTWASVDWDTEKGSNKNPTWRYQNGSMMKGFVDYYLATGKQEYLDFATNYMMHSDYKVGSSETSLDGLNAGKAVLDLYDVYKNMGKESEYSALLTKAKNTYNRFASVGRTGTITYTYTDDNGNEVTATSNNFEHKSGYDKQIWLDGLYMGLPIYSKYEIEYSGNDILDSDGHLTGIMADVFKQFQFVHYGMKDSRGLYHHGYDHSRAQAWSNVEPTDEHPYVPAGCAPVLWLRAIGWYAMAQIDVIELLPECPEKETMKKQFKIFVDDLIKWQDETGLWYEVPDEGERNDGKNWLETSGTCGIAYSIMKAARLNVLPKYYYNFGEVAFYGTIDKWLNSSATQLGGICKMGSLGSVNGDYEHDYSYYVGISKPANEAKGVAPFMMCLAEVTYDRNTDETSTETTTETTTQAPVVTVKLSNNLGEEISGEYEYNKKINAVARNIEGKKFSHWNIVKNDNTEKMVSKKMGYSFITEENITLKAYYVDNNTTVNKSSFVNFYKNADSRNNRYTFSAVKYLNNSNTFVNCGFLLSKTVSSEDELVVNSNNDNIIQGTYTTNNTLQFKANKSFNTEDEGMWYIRAFLTYKDGTNEKVVYSDEILETNIDTAITCLDAYVESSKLFNLDVIIL